MARSAAVRIGCARISRAVACNEPGAVGRTCGFGGGNLRVDAGAGLDGARARVRVWGLARILRVELAPRAAAPFQRPLHLRSLDASPSRASTSSRSAGSSASQLSITSRSAAFARPATARRCRPRSADQPRELPRQGRARSRSRRLAASERFTTHLLRRDRRRARRSQAHLRRLIT